MVASAALCVILSLSADSDYLALRRSLVDVPAAKWTEVFGTYVRMLGKATAKGKAKGKYSISKNEIPDTVAKAKGLTVPQVMYIVKLKGKKPVNLEDDIKKEDNDLTERKEEEKEKPVMKLADAQRIAKERVAKEKEEKTKIKVEYDKFQNTTTLSVTDLDLPNNNNELNTFEFQFYHVKEEDYYLMKIYSSSDGWQFLRYHPLTLLIDGQRLEIPHTKADDLQVGYVMEQINCRTDKVFLTRLANAKEAEGQLGRTEFKIPQDVRDKLKEFLVKAGELKAGPTK